MGHNHEQQMPCARRPNPRRALRQVNRRVAPIVAVMMSVAGCSGSGTPTVPTLTPSVASPAGHWSGAISDPISGDGSVQLSLSEQARDLLTGTWSATFKTGDNLSGPASAGLYPSTGYGIMLYVEPQPPCAGPDPSAALGFTLINVAVASSTLTAVAERTSCNGITFGTVNLSKQ
jgi:hypothetical protein